jgi:thiol-disulfide isomerase/thioredoxin
MRVKRGINALLGLIFCLLALFVAPAMAGGAMQNFVWHNKPVDVVDIEFRDGKEKPVKLSDFKDRIVLLNFWATWCAPCRREMPDLDALQKKYGSADFLVLALSQDRKGLKAVKEFYAETGVKSLALYIDQKARTSRKLRVPGLPTTVLLNRKGQEIGRLVGPADWFSEEAQKIIEKAMAGK